MTGMRAGGPYFLPPCHFAIDPTFATYATLRVCRRYQTFLARRRQAKLSAARQYPITSALLSGIMWQIARL